MTNSDAAAWYIPGGNRQQSDRPIDQGKVYEMYNAFGKTPEQMQGANIGVARLAGTIIGAINHMEQPDIYQKNNLDPELINRRNQLSGLIGNINNQIKAQELEQRRHVSKDDMDELNFLLGQSSPTISKAQNNTVTIQQPAQNNSIIKEASASNRYAEERNSSNSAIQFDLPLFDGTSGLTVADRTFIREEFDEIKKSLKQIEEKYNTLLNYMNNFTKPNLPVPTFPFEKNIVGDDPSKFDEVKCTDNDETFLTFDNEDEGED